jgi:hypothetical protein
MFVLKIYKKKERFDMPKAGRSRSDINHSIYSKQREKIKKAAACNNGTASLADNLH